MDLMEIILLVIGGIIFILSFVIPDKKEGKAGIAGGLTDKEVKELLKNEMETLRGTMNEMAQEAAADALEKTERSLERISNEKIMAVSEYSDTVLAEIHKNHEEAVFLYDMLNNKHTSLKNTASEVSRTVKEAEKTVAALKEKVTAPDNSTAKRFPAEKVGILKQEPMPKQEKTTGILSAQEIKENFQEKDKKEGSKNERILELFKQGKPAVDIAKELGLGVGEVRLVIGLYRPN